MECNWSFRATANRSTAIVIFEDKATDNARKMIKQKVWPDIVGLEAGGRVAEFDARGVRITRKASAYHIQISTSMMQSTASSGSRHATTA